MQVTDLQTQLVLIFIPPIITLIGAFILLAIRDVWLNKKNILAKNRRATIEKKLIHLYSPLYANLRMGTETLGKRSFFTTKRIDEKGEGKEKELIDKIIASYFFLASNELQPYLAKVYGTGFWHMDAKDAEKLYDLLERDYNALRDEYLGDVK